VSSADDKHDILFIETHILHIGHRTHLRDFPHCCCRHVEEQTTNMPGAGHGEGVLAPDRVKKHVSDDEGFLFIETKERNDTVDSTS
jgi:hypothetical protein